MQHLLSMMINKTSGVQATPEVLFLYFRTSIITL